MAEKKLLPYQRVHKCYLALADALERCRYEEAVALAEEIRQIGTRERQIWYAVLAAYIDGGAEDKAAEAAEDYRKIFDLAADGTGHFLLGRIKMLTGDWEGAEEEVSHALNLPMEDWYRGASYSILANLQRKLARPAEAAENYLKSVSYKTMATGSLADYSNYLFNLHYLDKPQDFMLRAAQRYGEMLSQVQQYSHRPHARPKMRIGYISPDLRFHVVAFFSYALMKDYDREHFEVYCYTNCQEDKASAEFASWVDGWRNVRGLAFEEIARVIHEDEVDILFDLAGHTARNMLPVLAYRPAPVQISGIGYFDTTGLAAVDYFLTDHYLDPVEEDGGNDRYFTEKLLRLPHSHFCYMWHDAPGQVGEVPFMQKGYITFGCLNNFAKVTDEMLALWGKILSAVPHSRLHLRAQIFNSIYGRKLALGRIEAAGIDLERVEALPFAPDYLKDYREIDIALDTYPYPGGGTTCDALYMGVPVVTLVGERHNARFGYSLLMNMGLGELCAFSQEEYVQKAIDLAMDCKCLQALHGKLRILMERSPVMASRPYVASVEQAYGRIYLKWLEKSGFAMEDSGLCWLNNYINDDDKAAEPQGEAGEERTIDMGKSSRKLNKKKEKATKVELKVRAAGLREQMGEQMEAGEYAEALGSLAELVKDNSYDPDLLYDGAYCYFMVGDYERATKWVDMVMDLAPYHIPARILLVRLCILNEREEGALSLANALLEANRTMLTEDQTQDLNDILEYYYRCEPERIRKDYPHVAAFVADLAEGVPVPSAGVAKPTAEVPVSQVKSETEKLQPEQESLQEAQAEAAADGEGGEDVEKTLQAIAEKPVTLQAKIRLYNVFAGGYFYQKNYVAAGKFLAEALKIDPLDPESLRNMAILCHEQGQKEKAQEYVSKLPQTDFLLLAALR